MSSTARRLWLAVGWAMVALVIYLSLTPVPPEPDIDLGDKLSHLIAYAGLMAWFGRVCVPRAPVALWLLALGLTLEVLQGLSGYRYAEALDMLANTGGIAVGWLAASLWTRIGADPRQSWHPKK